jgi:hypothetical protein
MNNNIRKLYAVIQNDKVLFVESNLKNFVERFKENDSGVKHSRNWFYTQFKKHSRFKYLSQTNEIYWLQQLV